MPKSYVYLVILLKEMLLFILDLLEEAYESRETKFILFVTLKLFDYCVKMKYSKYSLLEKSKKKQIRLSSWVF